MDKRFIKYFNQMTILIQRLLRETDIDNEIVGILEDTNNPRYTKIFNKLPEIMRADKNVQELILNDLTVDFFERSQSLIQEEDKYLYFLLLIYMDRAIGRCFNELSNLMEEVEEIDPLNDNVLNTGILLLKKTNCLWEHRPVSGKINSCLSYFYMIEQKNISGITIHNYVLDKSVIMTHGKTALKIGISPLTRDRHVEFSNPYPRMNEKEAIERYYFRVENVKEEKKLVNRIIKKIQLAGENGADILVFPEMLGTEEMKNTIMEQIEEGVCNKVPPLIIFPSVWEKTENNENNRNASSLLLCGQEIIFEQEKRKQFHYTKDGHETYEDIGRKKRDIINVLHIEGIGRIIIVICYDYLQDDNRNQIANNLYPTLICSPSFSTGSFHFEILKEALFYKNCNWVWCNTCSAANEVSEEKRKANFETIGIITKLNKKCDMSEPLEDRFAGIAKCTSENCENCIYYTEIPLRFT